MRRVLFIIFSVVVVTGMVAAYFFLLYPGRRNHGTSFVIQWIRNPQAHQEWAVEALSTCNNAPFLMPSPGLIGYVWDDSFRIGHRHQGIDIFAGTDIGVTPVYAAYDGYLNRSSDWKSTLIIRIPSDPLQPDRQIWTYYTHMADPQGNSLIAADFPAGSRGRYCFSKSTQLYSNI